MIDVAKVLKPQGLKGEIKVQCFTFDMDFWKNLREIYIDNVLYEIENVRFYKSFGYIKLTQINSQEEAQALRNKLLRVKKEDLKLKKDEFLISDLVSCQVFDEKGNFVGSIESVEKYGSADIINILLGGARNSFPFIQGLFIETDFINKKIIVNREKLDEVLV